MFVIYWTEEQCYWTGTGWNEDVGEARAFAEYETAEAESYKAADQAYRDTGLMEDGFQVVEI